jgi:hypothetical protein
MTTAVTIALREGLDRVRQQQGLSLADRLLEIGKDCAARLKEPFRSTQHGDLHLWNADHLNDRGYVCANPYSARRAHAEIYARVLKRIQNPLLIVPSEKAAGNLEKSRFRCRPLTASE